MCCNMYQDAPVLAILHKTQVHQAQHVELRDGGEKICEMPKTLNLSGGRCLLFNSARCLHIICQKVILSMSYLKNFFGNINFGV